MMGMFSGIVEAQSEVQFNSDRIENSAIRMTLQRPALWDDIKQGDSVCVNGVCLTVEKYDAEVLQFCLGAETLRCLEEHWQQWPLRPANIERSLRFGDRVHGHLVAGHVDGLGLVRESYSDGECWQLRVEVPAKIVRYFWPKGAITLSGVSLTVNEVEGGTVAVCLIPETLRATNLKSFKPGDLIPVEADYLARAVVR
jgi:riboflavin synthase